jgi:hypothetical protein
MIVFDEKTDKKVDSEVEGAMGDGWDFRSTKKEDILTTKSRVEVPSQIDQGDPGL